MRIGQTLVSPTIRPAAQAGHRAQIRLMPGTTHTAWEAAIATLFAPGDEVLVLGTGRVAALWAGLADSAGLVVAVLDAPTETVIARHLGADRFGTIKAVFAAQGARETALDLAAVRRALDTTFHDALLLVDASTAPDPDLCASGVDLVITDAAAGLARRAPRHPIAAE